MNADVFHGFVESEHERINKEQLEIIAELETVSCEIHKINLEKRLANLAGRIFMLNRCERIVSDMLSFDVPKIKYIHNPVTGKCYEIKQRTSEYGRRGVIKGLWSTDKP